MRAVHWDRPGVGPPAKGRGLLPQPGAGARSPAAALSRVPWQEVSPAAAPRPALGDRARAPEARRGEPGAAEAREASAAPGRAAAPSAVPVRESEPGASRREPERAARTAPP